VVLDPDFETVASLAGTAGSPSEPGGSSLHGLPRKCRSRSYAWLSLRSPSPGRKQEALRPSREGSTTVSPSRRGTSTPFTGSGSGSRAQVCVRKVGIHAASIRASAFGRRRQPSRIRCQRGAPLIPARERFPRSPDTRPILVVRAQPEADNAPFVRDLFAPRESVWVGQRCPSVFGGLRSEAVAQGARSGRNAVSGGTVLFSASVPRDHVHVRLPWAATGLRAPHRGSPFVCPSSKHESFPLA
jgi:hypothetical protein